MKEFSGYSLMIMLCVQSICFTADAGDRLLRRNQYFGNCETVDPLSTYDRCDRWSSLGRSAIACAIEDAMSLCRAQYNVECVESGTNAAPIMSREFMGYRKCIGTARVHGYEPISR